MKRLMIFFAISCALAGCGGGTQEKVSVNNAAAPTPTVEIATATPTATPAATIASTPTPTASDNERPIDFTYLGLTSNKEQIHYKIKVNTAKKISQVDLGIKYWDASGKVLDDTTLIWQNIVKSTRQPIEKGKTYDVLDSVPEDTAKADVSLKRVVFEDGTRWEAK